MFPSSASITSQIDSTELFGVQKITGLFLHTINPTIQSSRDHNSLGFEDAWKTNPTTFLPKRQFVVIYHMAETRRKSLSTYIEVHCGMNIRGQNSTGCDD